MWKRHQNTVYWVDIQLAQRKGLKLYQTRSNATIFYDTLPAYCIPKVVRMKSGDHKTRRYMCHLGLLQRFPAKIIGCVIWSQDSQRIQPKPKTQLSRTERPIGEEPFTQEIEKDVLFGREGTKNSTRTVRLVDGRKSIQSCVPLSVELVDKKKLEEIDIDGFQCARIVTCSCERSRKFPRSRARQVDRKSSSSIFKPTCSRTIYNPFSDDSKAMIREMDNVELLELCETIPKVQCSQCLLHWKQGVICCNCAQFLSESESRRKFL